MNEINLKKNVGINPNLRVGPFSVYKQPQMTCYICGRDFGSKSIDIHLPSCREKYIKEHGKEPPAKPSEEIIHKLINQGMSSAQAYNEAAFFSAQDAREQCVNCGRKFNPSALAVHLRSCTQYSKASPVKSNVQSPTSPTHNKSSNNTFKQVTSTISNRPQTSMPQSVPAVIRPKTSKISNSLNNSPERDQNSPTQRTAFYPSAPQIETNSAKNSKKSHDISNASLSINTDHTSNSPTMMQSPHKFCVECGCVFASSSAKFCGECGFKR